MNEKPGLHPFRSNKPSYKYHFQALWQSSLSFIPSIIILRIQPLGLFLRQIKYPGCDQIMSIHKTLTNNASAD